MLYRITWTVKIHSSSSLTCSFMKCLALCTIFSRLWFTWHTEPRTCQIDAVKKAVAVTRLFRFLLFIFLLFLSSSSFIFIFQKHFTTHGCSINDWRCSINDTQCVCVCVCVRCETLNGSITFCSSSIYGIYGRRSIVVVRRLKQNRH